MTGETLHCFLFGWVFTRAQNRGLSSQYFHHCLTFIWYIMIFIPSRRQRVQSTDIKRTSLSQIVLLAGCLDREKAKLTHFINERDGSSCLYCMFLHHTDKAGLGEWKRRERGKAGVVNKQTFRRWMSQLIGWARIKMVLQVYYTTCNSVQPNIYFTI